MPKTTIYITSTIQRDAGCWLLVLHNVLSSKCGVFHGSKNADNHWKFCVNPIFELNCCLACAHQLPQSFSRSFFIRSSPLSFARCIPHQHYFKEFCLYFRATMHTYSFAVTGFWHLFSLSKQNQPDIVASLSLSLLLLLLFYKQTRKVSSALAYTQGIDFN